jgi:hypothetical protein
MNQQMMPTMALMLTSKHASQRTGMKKLLPLLSLPLPQRRLV